MQAKRPGFMKNTARAASGGVIVIAAFLALMLFRGTGTGDGDAEAPGTPDTSPGETLASTEMPATTPLAPPAESDSTGGLTPDEQKALSGKVLGVLIDEHSYLLEVPSDDKAVFKPISLERLTELARRAEGDSNGIKVRVLRRESARMGATFKLQEALASVKIGEDALYIPAEFVP